MVVRKDSVGSAIIWLAMFVIVPPVMDEANVVNNPKVIVNRTVLLECPVNGFPPPQVQWLKNGQPLEPEAGLKLIGNGRIVEITRVQLNATGRYTCVALNDAGELRRDYDLEVLGKTLVHIIVFSSHLTSKTMINGAIYHSPIVSKPTCLIGDRSLFTSG